MQCETAAPAQPSDCAVKTSCQVPGAGTCAIAGNSPALCSSPVSAEVVGSHLAAVSIRDRRSAQELQLLSAHKPSSLGSSSCCSYVLPPMSQTSSLAQALSSLRVGMQPEGCPAASMLQGPPAWELRCHVWPHGATGIVLPPGITRGLVAVCTAKALALGACLGSVHGIMQQWPASDPAKWLTSFAHAQQPAALHRLQACLRVKQTCTEALHAPGADCCLVSG